jgi:hypothetical protein
VAYIFPITEYPSVRAAIGADINAILLPDEMLGSDIYKGETERFIMRSLSQAQIDNTAYAADIQYAAVLFMSFLAAPKIRLVDYEKIVGGAISYSKVDLMAIAQANLELAQNRINDIIQTDIGETTTASQNPNFFIKARRRNLRTLGGRSF